MTRRVSLASDQCRLSAQARAREGAARSWATAAALPDLCVVADRSGGRAVCVRIVCGPLPRGIPGRFCVRRPLESRPGPGLRLLWAAPLCLQLLPSAGALATE